MMRVPIALCLLTGSFAFRVVHKTKTTAASWATRTDASHGPCAAYMDYMMPIYIPLWCTGEARDLKFTSNATGQYFAWLYLAIDGEEKGFRDYPWPKGSTRQWSVTHPSLSPGLHMVKYSANASYNMKIHDIQLQGSGASCSFEDIDGYDAQSYTNAGMDAITRVVGPNRDFSEVAKKGLHFASETLGRNADNSISATVTGNGMWEFLYRYSDESRGSSDPWLAKKAAGGMYEESDIQPYLNVSLDAFPGRSGDEMTVCEPCNTVSNIVYAEAAVWVSCRGFPFGQDELASLMSALTTMAAGSAFMHASCTFTGQLGDTLPMNWLMYQIHQIMVTDVTNRATTLTQAERNAILYPANGGLATDHAKSITALFRDTSSLTKWKSGMQDIKRQIPDYLVSIITVILTTVESINGKWPSPEFGEFVNGIIDVLLEAVASDEKVNKIVSAFRPAIRKVFAEVKLCDDAVGETINRFLAFVLTFVEALIFQEEMIPVSDAIRRLFEGLNFAGYYTDMRSTWDYYNTQRTMCENRSAHATWHEKAGLGLVQFVKAAELMVTKTTCSS